VKAQVTHCYVISWFHRVVTRKHNTSLQCELTSVVLPNAIASFTFAVCALYMSCARCVLCMTAYLLMCRNAVRHGDVLTCVVCVHGVCIFTVVTVTLVVRTSDALFVSLASLLLQGDGGHTVCGRVRAVTVCDGGMHPCHCVLCAITFVGLYCISSSAVVCTPVCHARVLLCGRAM